MKAEEFKTVNDLRKLREDALIKAYEKTATELYGRTFLPNWAQDNVSLNGARSIMDKMDAIFENEWRHIGDLYGWEESEESND